MTSPDRDPSRRATGPEEPDDLRHVVHHASLPETGLSRAIDGAIKRFGSWISWFWILLLVVICVNVFMKQVLGQGSVQFEEIQWHIYSALFLLGLSYTMSYDDHVRVDLLYEQFGLRTKAWVDLIGLSLFLVPFILVMIWWAVPFVINSYVDNERSASPAGLGQYWIIKSALIFGFALLLLTSVARISRCIAAIAGATGR